MSTPLLDSIVIDTGADPRACMIVLHGLGADGSDFVPICEQLALDAVGPVRFVFPHAPVRPVTVNNGYRMRAWYDILGMDIDRKDDEAGLRESIALVEALLDDQRERGIAPERTVLAGFSQGCAMSLLAGLRHGQRLAGIAGLSGYLPMAAATAAERHAANHAVPIFLAHGQGDPVIPLPAAQAARDALRALGHDVEWHEYAMAHSVCPQEIIDLNRWLLRVLA